MLYIQITYWSWIGKKRKKYRSRDCEESMSIQCSAVMKSKIWIHIFFWFDVSFLSACSCVSAVSERAQRALARNWKWFSMNARRLCSTPIPVPILLPPISVQHSALLKYIRIWIYRRAHCIFKVFFVYSEKILLYLISNRLRGEHCWCNLRHSRNLCFVHINQKCGVIRRDARGVRAHNPRFSSISFTAIISIWAYVNHPFIQI